MDILGYHLPGIAAAAAAFGSVYAAFAKFDADQSDENRKFVRDWLLGLKADDRQWSRFFTELFAAAFGERHFSLKCFGRSAALSAALVACISAYLVVSSLDASLLLLLFVFLWMSVAIIEDYLSLWKTRFLLTKRNIFNNAPVAVAIVVVDASITLLISAITVIAAVVSAFLISDYGLSTTLLIWSVIPSIVGSAIEELFRSDTENGIRLLFLAPLLTSAWLWVYLIVAYGMRAINHVPPLLKVLSKVMDFQGHPVRTIGYVAGTTSAVVVGLFSFL